METERSDSENESEQEVFTNLQPRKQNKQKDLSLTVETKAETQNLIQKAMKRVQLNSHIDPQNTAKPYILKTHKQNISFNNFMTKKKNKDKRKEAFKEIRQILEELGHAKLSKVSEKEERSVMVVRFVSKMENSNVMEIEDEISESREKIVIKQGVAWIGMICAIEASWENQMYKLERIIELVKPAPFQAASLRNPASAYRMLMVKGPFWRNDKSESVGTQLILDEVSNLRYRQNVRVDMVVVMGPVVSQNNELVKNFQIERTFEEEFEEIVKILHEGLEKIIPSIELLVIPSTDDVISMHPIPQPEFELQYRANVKYGSNPCNLHLSDGASRKHTINFINYDIISYIDDSKAGRSTYETLQENLSTYLKQPFYLTNTLEAPFDETNLSSLYNRGQFGDVIVFSSQYHPPIARKVNGKVFVNIGSMGIDYHMQEKHYMVMMSIFEGQGELEDRIKVETVIM